MASNNEEFDYSALTLILITKLRKSTGSIITLPQLQSVLPWEVPPSVINKLINTMFTTTSKSIKKNLKTIWQYHNIDWIIPPNSETIDEAFLNSQPVHAYISLGQLTACRKVENSDKLRIGFASNFRGIKDVQIDPDNKLITLIVNNDIISIPDGIKTHFSNITDLLQSLRCISFLTLCPEQSSKSCPRVRVPSIYSIKTKEALICDPCKLVRYRKKTAETTAIVTEIRREFTEQLDKVGPKFRHYVEYQMERTDHLPSSQYPPEILAPYLRIFDSDRRLYEHLRSERIFGNLPHPRTLLSIKSREASKAGSNDEEKKGVGRKKKRNDISSSSKEIKHSDDNQIEIHGKNQRPTGQVGKNVGMRKRKNNTTSSKIEVDEFVMEIDRQASTDQEETGVQRKKKKNDTSSSSDAAEDSDDCVIEIHGENRLPTGQVEIVSANTGFGESTTNPLFDNEDRNPGVLSFDDTSAVFEYDGEKWLDRNGMIIDENYSLTNPGEKTPVGHENSAVITEKLPVVETNQIEFPGNEVASQVQANEREIETKTVPAENSTFNLRTSEDSEERNTERAKINTKPCSAELAQIGNILDQMQN